jgi:hypothetical protein
MESIDNAKAARVWQRVKAAVPSSLPTPRPEQEILELIVGEWTDAITYSKLSQHYRGYHRNRLQKMAAQARSNTTCLKGIYTLMTGTRPKIRSSLPPMLPPEQALRRCYSRETQRLAHYTQRAADPEYGQVFAQLAQQSRQHCRLIPELLGTQKRSRPAP